MCSPYALNRLDDISIRLKSPGRYKPYVILAGFKTWLQDESVQGMFVILTKLSSGRDEAFIFKCIPLDPVSIGKLNSVSSYIRHFVKPFIPGS